MKPITCLGCEGEMTKRTCRCGGAWLSEARLVEKAKDIRGELVGLPWAKRGGTQRRCPVCADEMETVLLVEVALDRCAAHGVWFDAFELQTVLERAGQLPHADAPAPKPEKPDASDASDVVETVGGVFSIFGLLLDLLD